jgi:hypothetical protein
MGKAGVAVSWLSAFKNLSWKKALIVFIKSTWLHFSFLSTLNSLENGGKTLCAAGSWWCDDELSVAWPCVPTRLNGAINWLKQCKY